MVYSKGFLENTQAECVVQPSRNQLSIVKDLVQDKIAVCLLLVY